MIGSLDLSPRIRFLPLASICTVAVATVLLLPWGSPGPFPSAAAGFTQDVQPEAPMAGQAASGKARYAPDAVLVAFHSRATAKERAAVLRKFGLENDPMVDSPYFVRLIYGDAQPARPVGVDELAAELRREPAVRLAEPDLVLVPDQTLPNDAQFGQQWHYHNTGQTGGTPDADIDLPEAWQIVGTRPPVVVALMDDGVQYTHPDLTGNMWSNPDETLNGIDDDGNGRIDDVRGWDFSDGDNDPFPGGSDSHGTHTAGTIAAVTDNGIGVAGVSRNVRLLPVRMYGGAAGFISALIQGIDYARVEGAKVISVSYNIDGYTTLLVEAIQRAATADILYVNSAGNNSQNIDSLRGAIRNMTNNAIFVASTDHNDALSSFSNFGNTVDIAAPGSSVLSTVNPNTYGNFSGTSMACPHVAGAAAVLRSYFPTITAPQLITRLRTSSDPKASLAGRILGGRLNLANALDTDTTPPAAPTGLTVSARATHGLRMQFVSPGDDGMTGTPGSYEIRFSRNPITAGNFASATPINSVPPPAPSGSTVSFQAIGLFPGESFYVAARAVDNLGNIGALATAGPFATRTATIIDRVEGAALFAGAPWATTTTQAASGLRSWTDSPAGNYGNSVDVSLTSTASYPITGSTFLRFSARLSLETNWDFLHAEVSPNNGATWTRVGTWTGEPNTWQVYSANVSAFAGQSVRIRFRLVTDSSVTRDGVYLDDIYVAPVNLIWSDNVEGAARFTAGAPWATTTAQALSPVRSWADSPVGDYGNNANATLTGNETVNVTSLADAHAVFGMNLATELFSDSLRVLVAADAGATLERTRYSGTNGWGHYAAPVQGIVSGRVSFQFVSNGSTVADGVYLDDIGFAGEPWEPVTLVTGTVNLDGYTGPPAAEPMTLVVRNAGVPVFTTSVVLTPTGPEQGSFSVIVPAQGVHDLALKGSHWLRRTLTGVNLVPGLANQTFNLLNGDIDGSNAIDSDDYDILVANFGLAVATGDLTGDNLVDSDDFDILVRNFGLNGNP